MNNIKTFIFCIISLLVFSLDADAAWYTEEEIYQMAYEVAENTFDGDIHPSLLTALAWHESRYNSDADNGLAVGLCQVIPWCHEARMKKFGVTSLKDPMGCLTVAADYLIELNSKYGSEEFSIKAYGMGENAALSTPFTPDFVWDILAIRDEIKARKEIEPAIEELIEEYGETEEDNLSRGEGGRADQPCGEYSGREDEEWDCFFSIDYALSTTWYDAREVETRIEKDGIGYCPPRGEERIALLNTEDRRSLRKRNARYARIPRA